MTEKYTMTHFSKTALYRYTYSLLIISSQNIKQLCTIKYYSFSYVKFTCNILGTCLKQQIWNYDVTSSMQKSSSSIMSGLVTCILKAVHKPVLEWQYKYWKTVQTFRCGGHVISLRDNRQSYQHNYTPYAIRKLKKLSSNVNQYGIMFVIT